MPELTDAERLDLNRQIAEWMGWTQLRGNLYGKHPSRSGHFLEVVPDFTRDWYAMELVVERLNELGWVVRLYAYPDGTGACNLVRYTEDGQHLRAAKDTEGSTLPETVGWAALKVPNVKEASDADSQRT